MQNKAQQTQMNLFLDFALTIAFLVLLQPFHSGLLIHEWLGLALGGAIIIHMLLHWQWIVAITRKLSGKLPSKARLYYALDVALLAGFFIILASGVLLSQIALPLFALRGNTGHIVGNIHEHASYLTLALLVIKLVLHRKWIAHAVRRYIFRGSPAVTAQPTSTSPAALTLTPVTQADIKGQISRRRFLVIGGSTVCIAALAGACAHLQKHESADAEMPVAAESATTQQSQPNTEPLTATMVVQQHRTTRCPHGLVNDPYPGRCRRYTDQNGNGICDLSETT